MQLAVRGEPLDGRDLGAVGLDREDRAGFRAPAVHEDGAGAALTGVAPDVRAGQAQLLAQEVDQEHAGVDVSLARLAVHGHRDLDHVCLLSGKGHRAKWPSTPERSGALSCGDVMVGIDHFTSSFSPALTRSPTHCPSTRCTRGRGLRGQQPPATSERRRVSPPRQRSRESRQQRSYTAASPRPTRAQRGSDHHRAPASRRCPTRAAQRAIRATIMAAGASSDTPSNKPATSGGDHSKVNPTPVSANAVTTSSILATTTSTNNR